MTRDQFVSFFFIALLILVVHQIIIVFSPFFQAIFWSAILAFAFFPVYDRLRRQFRRSETVTAVLVTVGIFLTVIPPALILIINLAGQAIELYQLVLNYIREGRLEMLIQEIRSFHWIQRVESRLFQWELVQQTVSAWLLNSSRALGNFVADQAKFVTKNLFLFGLNAGLMTILIFIFLKDGEKIYRFFYEMAPLEPKNKKHIFGQINETLAAVIRGQLLTSVTQAAVAWFIFWAMGLPIPIFFATLTFFTALIPVFGASMVWFPLVVYLMIGHAYVKAAVLFLFGSLVISLIDNLMKPALIGEKTRLPYFLLFFGILGGLRVYGLMGIFIAPVLLSLFFALIKIYQEKFL